MDRRRCSPWWPAVQHSDPTTPARHRPERWRLAVRQVRQLVSLARTPLLTLILTLSSHPDPEHISCQPGTGGGGTSATNVSRRTRIATPRSCLSRMRSVIKPLGSTLGGAWGQEEAPSGQARPAASRSSTTQRTTGGSGALLRSEISKQSARRRKPSVSTASGLRAFAKTFHV